MDPNVYNVWFSMTDPLLKPQHLRQLLLSCSAQNNNITPLIHTVKLSSLCSALLQLSKQDFIL